MPSRRHAILPRLTATVGRLTLPGLLVAALGAHPAAAQIGQYTAAGSVLDARQSQKAEMEKAIADARWRLGGLRLDPALSLSGPSYTSDVFSGSSGPEESDLTATVSAGLRGYLPLGRKSTLAAFALPHYNWWQDLEERRSTGGLYGAGLFGYFNRMSLEVEGSVSETQSFVTQEIEQKAEARDETVTATVEIELARSITVFASATGTDYEFESFDEPGSARFDLLNRRQELARGGLAFQLGPNTKLAVGAEHARFEFEDFARDLSSSGTSVLMVLSYLRSKVTFNTELVQRSLEPIGDSRFPSVDETTGRIQTLFQARPRLSLRLYGARDLQFALNPDYSYFLDDRYGVGFSWELGRRWTVEGFVEEGRNDYVEIEAGVPERTDDIHSVGGRLALQVRPKVELQLDLSRREYDSSLPGFDRDLTQALVNLSFGQRSWP